MLSVIPGLVPGIQLTTGAGARQQMDPGDKHRDDVALALHSLHCRAGRHHFFASPKSVRSSAAVLLKFVAKALNSSGVSQTGVMPRALRAS